MSENTERRYLKWYNKVGYGSGDVAGNVVYAFLSSFVMIYLTDTVGLNPGIVGTLIDRPGPRPCQRGRPQRRDGEHHRARRH